MGNRISKVYTRTGDDGTTGMADGTRIAKDTSVIQAMGDIDETNSSIGLLRAEDLPELIEHALQDIQNDLFSLGGELAMPTWQTIIPAHIEKLESQIDHWNKDLTPLKEFILPAGSRTVALCHQARTICRRSERTLVALSHEQHIRDEIMQYINRLSDYLFVLARYLASKDDIGEIYWKK